LFLGPQGIEDSPLLEIHQRRFLEAADVICDIIYHDLELHAILFQENVVIVSDLFFKTLSVKKSHQFFFELLKVLRLAVSLSYGINYVF